MQLECLEWIFFTCSLVIWALPHVVLKPRQSTCSAESMDDGDFTSRRWAETNASAARRDQVNVSPVPVLYTSRGVTWGHGRSRDNRYCWAAREWPHVTIENQNEFGKGVGGANEWPYWEYRQSRTEDSIITFVLYTRHLATWNKRETETAPAKSIWISFKFLLVV